MSDAPPRQGLLVILDGLGDRPSEALDGRTPLEAAHTPHLNRLVAEGQCGLTDPLLPGVPVDTHVGTSVLLGLAPREAMRLARGPVEATGAGVPLLPGDVALRCNLATLHATPDGLHIRDRRAGRVRDEVPALADTLVGVSLGEGITGSLHPATGHRTILRLTGAGLSDAIGDTDPGSGTEPCMLRPCRPLEESAAAHRTALAVDRFVAIAHERLRTHPLNRAREAAGLLPANGVITRGAGAVAATHNLVQHLGLRAAVLTREATVAGLARLFHFTPIELGGEDGARHAAAAGDELPALVAATEAALQDHDLVFLHIKDPDIFSHDRDPVGKRDVLERIDSALVPLLKPDRVIAVSGDHTTDSRLGRHVGDPVPSLLRVPLGRIDDRTIFGETDAAAGGLGRISSSGLLWSLLDGMGVLPNLRPRDAAYFA